MTTTARTPPLIIAQRSFWRTHYRPGVGPSPGVISEECYARVRLDSLSEEDRAQLPQYLREGLRLKNGVWVQGPPHETAWCELTRGADGSWELPQDGLCGWNDHFTGRAYPEYGTFNTEAEARAAMIKDLRNSVSEQQHYIDTVAQRIEAFERGESPTEPLPDLHENCYD